MITIVLMIFRIAEKANAVSISITVFFLRALLILNSLIKHNIRYEIM